MESKAIIKVKKESIFKRISNFINKIFTREKYIGNKEEKEEIDFTNCKNSIDKLYRVDIPDEVNYNIINEGKRKRKLHEIIQIIESNPETLEKLDIPKLEVIDKYYKEKIIECRRKIENLS